MYCFQCQEAANNVACTVKGVCGKTDEVSDLQDLLVYLAKGVSILAQAAKTEGKTLLEADRYVFDALFITITNANFDKQAIIAKILEANQVRANLLALLSATPSNLHDCARWQAVSDEASLLNKAKAVGIIGLEPNEDLRSLKELLVYGVKGMAAYAEHAYNLGRIDQAVFDFMHKALALSTTDAGADVLVGAVLECGKFGVDVMALLDKANTDTYGHPEISTVNIGVGTNPGILISGHDLKDIEQLLQQTEGTGVDVYTHCEMLPAHYYPALKKYKHLVGNYGNAWWQQKEEFESFNGPILFTTNCIVPPKDSYKSRMYTTGTSGYEGCAHIPAGKDGKPKDFSVIIEQAKTCKPPTQIESGSIVGGFAHNQVSELAGAVVDAVKTGAVKKFFVMAGCDGRQKGRNYYTDFAKELPQDTIILTAGCAKFRYNKLELGTIGGIPRVLDAGQCNDSYSLAITALKLKEAFGLDDINQLPIAYNIAWYEQKAVIVLLALLYLGVKNIHLGPTLPAFLSPGVAKVLVEQFGIAGTSTVEADLAAFLS